MNETRNTINTVAEEVANEPKTQPAQAEPAKKRNKKENPSALCGFVATQV